MTAAEERSRYEAAVRGLRQEADGLIAEGRAAEDVAIELVRRRNALKRVFRIGMEPAVLAVIEARNVALYGDPLGPTAPMLLGRYGNWLAVIEAACRPADLSQRLDGRKVDL